jgi:hypothetical protein
VYIAFGLVPPPHSAEEDMFGTWLNGLGSRLKRDEYLQAPLLISYLEEDREVIMVACQNLEATVMQIFVTISNRICT